MAVTVFRVALVVLATLSMVVDGQPPNMVFGDDPRKPVEINDELLCEVCHAVFSVVGTKLGNKKTETAVYEAVDGVCDQSNFRVFKMIPPTMKKGCDAFMDKHGDGLEEKMFKLGMEAAEAAVCETICQGQTWEPPGTPPPAPPAAGKKKKKTKKTKRSKHAEEL